MKITQFLSLVFVLSVSSCMSLEKGSIEQNFRYNLKPEKLVGSLDFNNLVESYQYVQLQTDSNSLVGEIKKVLVSGDNLIILSDGITCFNTDGKHQYSISKKGRGPSEFIQATDMSVDKNILYLYDNYQYKMMAFDLESGSFLESFRMVFSAKEVQLSGNTLLCNRGSIPNPYIKSSNQLIITSRQDQEHLSSFMPIDTPNFIIANQFYGNDEQFYWIDPIFNKVYKIEDGRPNPYLHLDFGPLNITAEEFNENPPLNTFSSSGKAFSLSRCLETDKTLYARVQIGENPVEVWINKSSRRTLSIDNINAKPYQFRPGAQCTANGKFYNIIPVLEANFMKFNMLEQKYKLDPSDSDYSNYKVIKEFKEENNPILAIYKINI